MTALERAMETGWLPGTPVGDTVLRRFLANQAEVNEMLALARGGVTERNDDVAMASAGPVTGFLNEALLLRPVLTGADPVLDAVAGFHARHGGLLVSIWPTPDLSGRGWHLVGHPTFVVRAPGPAAGASETAPGVEVRDVTTVDGLRRFEDVVAEGYPIERAADGAPTLADPLLSTPLRLRTAAAGGRPVAAAMGHVSHGVVNLCLAATLPAARRRGAWAALVWRRVVDDPTLPAVAFTSDLSRPGFERMGFLAVTRFTLWAVPGEGAAISD